MFLLVVLELDVEPDKGTRNCSDVWVMQCQTSHTEHLNQDLASLWAHPYLQTCHNNFLLAILMLSQHLKLMQWSPNVSLHCFTTQPNVFFAVQALNLAHKG